jgi:hypothetical protein
LLGRPAGRQALSGGVAWSVRETRATYAEG